MEWGDPAEEKTDTLHLQAGQTYTENKGSMTLRVCEVAVMVGQRNKILV